MNVYTRLGFADTGPAGADVARPVAALPMIGAARGPVGQVSRLEP